MSSASIGSPSHRQRKLRKGAHSCWECKRRKTKCIFTSSKDNVCLRCRQNGRKCVNQAEQEPNFVPLERFPNEVLNNRLDRIEDMLQILVDGRQERTDTGRPRTDSITPEAVVVQSPSAPGLAMASPNLRPTSPQMPEYSSTTLAETLYSFLPTTKEARVLCSSRNFNPCFFQQVLPRNFIAVSTSGCTPLTMARVATLPPRNAHPVLIAQKILLFACLIQYNSSPEVKRKCGARGQQMAEMAIELVTTRDDLIRNTEGLECLMLEATYRINRGELQSAFSVVRRAMAMAQLLGIHRSPNKTIEHIDNQLPEFDSSYMWFRIVYTDRLLCLVLGLPQGSTDVMNAGAAPTDRETREEAFEKAYCIIACQILTRNEDDPGNEKSIIMTEMIDRSIQNIASTFPSSWWRIPAFSAQESEEDSFKATSRLVSQVLHYNLVNQTHLPYLFMTRPKGSPPTKSDYSRSACSNASREILHRYILLEQSGRIAHAYPFVHFIALIAAITLLLLQLDGHWTSEYQQQNVLFHMRSCDRAMAEQVKGLMVRPPVNKAPRILDQLLLVEEEAFLLRSVGSGKIMKDSLNHREFFELNIPFFGQLRVNAADICFKRLSDIEEISSRVDEIPTKEHDTAVVHDPTELTFEDFLTGFEADVPDPDVAFNDFQTPL